MCVHRPICLFWFQKDKEEVAKDLMLQIYSKPDLRLLYDQVVSSNNKRELVHSMGSNETDMEM